MSYVARLTFAFSVFVMFWYVIVVCFAMDDVAIEKAVSVPGRANLPSTAGVSVNETTTGEFSVANLRDISFVRRFWITVYNMPWWVNLFLGLFNGLILLILTVLWIIKVVHGNG